MGAVRRDVVLRWFIGSLSSLAVPCIGLMAWHFDWPAVTLLLCLVPIAVAAWFVGAGLGLALCACSAACDLAVEISSAPADPAMFWRALVSLSAFTVACDFLYEFKRRRRGLGVRINQRHLAVLAGVGMCLLAATVLLATPRVAHPSRATAGQGGTWVIIGPWGTLRCTRTSANAPDEQLLAQCLTLRSSQWVFHDMDAPRLLETLRSAGLDEPLAARLVEEAQWSLNVCTVLPDRQTLLSLAPDVRASLYAVLARDQSNTLHLFPFRVGPERLAELRRRGATQGALELIQRLSYHHGGQVLFADLQLVLDSLSDRTQRIRLLAPLMDQKTVLAKLDVDEHSDIEALTAYWGAYGRQAEIRSLLESVARVDGGYRIGVVFLLPPFARERLQRFPDKTDARADCHWSSMNFWNRTPDDRFLDHAYLEQQLMLNYDRVEGPRQFGDIVVLLDSRGSGVHSAVHIADDLVFTKNGPTSLSPWVLETMGDLLEVYAGQGPITVATFRPKPSPLGTPALTSGG